MWRCLPLLAFFAACEDAPCAQDSALLLVPGTSQEWGHHKAPPRELEARGVRISAEFAARLDRAYALLQEGAAQELMISGGAIDAERPDYVEAERGREYLIERHAI